MRKIIRTKSHEIPNRHIRFTRRISDSQGCEIRTRARESKTHRGERGQTVANQVRDEVKFTHQTQLTMTECHAIFSEMSPRYINDDHIGISDHISFRIGLIGR